MSRCQRVQHIFTDTLPLLCCRCWFACNIFLYMPVHYYGSHKATQRQIALLARSGALVVTAHSDCDNWDVWLASVWRLARWAISSRVQKKPKKTRCKTKNHPILAIEVRISLAIFLPKECIDGFCFWFRPRCRSGKLWGETMRRWRSMLYAHTDNKTGTQAQGKFAQMLVYSGGSGCKTFARKPGVH